MSVFFHMPSAGDSSA